MSEPITESQLAAWENLAKSSKNATRCCSASDGGLAGEGRFRFVGPRHMTADGAFQDAEFHAMSKWIVLALIREVRKQDADATILVDPADDRHDIIDRLMAENDRLRSLLLSEEPMVRKLTYTQEDGLEVELQHWAVRCLAESLKDSLFDGREAKDVNFLTLTVSHPDVGPIEVTLQKVWGGKKTPADQINELKQRIAALEQERDTIIATLNDRWQAAVGQSLEDAEALARSEQEYRNANR